MITVKCRHCGKQINKDTAYNWAHKQRYYCNEKCAIEDLGQEEFYKGNMLDEIWNLSGKEGNFVAFKAQVENYHDQNKWKYSGMYYTVKYFQDVLERAWNPEWGAGQIFNLTLYNEARDFYSQKHNVNQQFLDLAASLGEEPTIYVRRKKMVNWTKKYMDSIEILENL
jgi:hypothetical protein